MFSDVLTVSFWGALFSLDVTAFGQFLLGRPLVCATFIGWILGYPDWGLGVGVLLEFLWMGFLPVGTKIVFDEQSTAVLTIGLVLLAEKQPTGSGLMAAFIIAIIGGGISHLLVFYGRRLNSVLLHWIERGLEKGREYYLNYGIILGLLGVFILRFLFYYICLPLGVYFLPGLKHLLHFLNRGEPCLLLYFLPLLGFSSLFNLFFSREIFWRRA